MKEDNLKATFYYLKKILFIIYLITICFIPGYDNVFGVRFKSDASI